MKWILIGLLLLQAVSREPAEKHPAAGAPSPDAPHPIPAGVSCPCYGLANLLVAWDDCTGSPAKSVTDTLVFVSCDSGSVVTTWLSVNDADSCEVQTDTLNSPSLVGPEQAITPDEAQECIDVNTAFDAARP